MKLYVLKQLKFLGNYKAGELGITNIIGIEFRMYNK